LGRTAVYVEPVLAFTLTSYVLLLPTFAADQLPFPKWLSYLVISTPFIGRFVGALLLSRFSRFSTSRAIYTVSFACLGLLSMVEAFNLNPWLLLSSRFLVGVIFGTVTSLAVGHALARGDRVVVGVTMAGWAMGWLGAAITYLTLHWWTPVTLAGLGCLVSIPLFKDELRMRVSFKVPSASSILIYALALEPTYALMLAPGVLGLRGVNAAPWISWAYFTAIFAYIFLPRLHRSLSVVFLISGVSGFLFFFTGLPFLLIPVAFLSLGILAALPDLIDRRSRLSAGAALNISSFEGAIIPVIGSMTGDLFLSALTLLSMSALSLLTRRRA